MEVQVVNQGRRGFLRGMAGILAAAAAPAIITTPGLLMPVKALPLEFAWAMDEGMWTQSGSGVLTMNLQIFLREIAEKVGVPKEMLVEGTAWSGPSGGRLVV